MTNELLRIGDLERNEAVSFLQTHAEQGRLTTDEFGERVGAVNAARTHGDLLAVFRDLPAPKPRDAALPAPMTSPAPAPAPAYGGAPYAPPSPYGAPPPPPYGYAPQPVQQVVINQGGPMVMGYRKYNSFWAHVLLFIFTAGIGNIIYAWYIWDWNNRHGY